MVQLSSALLLTLSALSLHAHGAPIHKRIAQVIADSTALWEKACIAAGGAEQCNPISVTAFTTLLAAAGPCEQQDSADAMVDLAKTLNSDADMIKFAQIFAQQPRNTPNSVAVPYCQSAPKNAELDGLFQCQFQGADQQTFVGGLALGAAGTIPFGLSAPLSPLGACPANPAGPIADGTQLTDITQDPGLENVLSESDCGDDDDDDDNSSTETAAATSTVAAVKTTKAAATTTSAAASASTSTTSSSSSSSSSSTSNIQLQNALSAQKLNSQFSTLTSSASCTDGDQACVDGAFAMCVGGKFVSMGCAAPTRCFALPLVNKAGTSLACTTQDDAAARIAAAGAGGGITGSN